MRRVLVLLVVAVGVACGGCGSAGSGSGRPVTILPRVDEVPVAQQLAVSILALDDRGRFLVVDGLADLPGGGIGTSIWVYEPDAGFERLDHEGPPVVALKLWPVGDAVNVMGLSCPGIRTAAQRGDDDSFGQMCDEGSLLMQVQPAAGRVTTLADDLPGSWDQYADIVAGPDFTLLEVVRPLLEQGEGASSDVYELDDLSGRLRKLGTGPYAATCRSGDQFLRVSRMPMTPNEPVDRPSAQVVGTSGLGPPLDIPAPPGAVVGAYGECDPAGGIRYPAGDFGSGGAWVLDLEGGALKWTHVPPVPGAPDKEQVQYADGHTYAWKPVAGDDSFDHYDLYEVVDGRWVLRGSVKGPDEPSKETFSGTHVLGIAWDPTMVRPALRELP